jgi:predicted CoA-substrate-specific enzyme activase
MKSDAPVLGIDIGSVAITVAAVSFEKEILHTGYAFHHGNIGVTLQEMLHDGHLETIAGIAATTSTPDIVRATCRYDNRVSMITAGRRFHPTAGAILFVGGEKFGLIQLDGHGNYAGFRSNTSCAAGTGSFLDQQAERLNLENVSALSEIAFGNAGKTPKIASRCAVFAKTDLVHAQQEGYTLSEICDGLCYGLAKNVVDTLFGYRDVEPPLVFTAGVAKNKAVVKHVEALIGMPVIVDTQPYGAIGAAFSLLDEASRFSTVEPIGLSEILCGERSEKKYYFAPLTLKLSAYPDFGGKEQYLFSAEMLGMPNPVEVELFEDSARFGETNSRLNVYLGLDIGSTSTKAVLMDPFGCVLAGFYTRTAGRPVAALQNLFKAIQDLLSKRHLNLCIIGAGTTGSGRKFSGKIIGADLVIDEISAHARAASEIQPNVDTILEIGGQDSKFTTLKNGQVVFSIMNTVCAAGTGSFIEEQARNLGCPLAAYSQRTQGQRSPMVSDRCTVFMARDINYYLSAGYTKDEILTAVLHSIRENYLSKVAIQKLIGDTILFQGATAKNRALVAAFEQHLKKPIHVSQFCHLTGAMGAALMLVDAGTSQTKFRGLDLAQKKIPIRSEVCGYCTNHCKLTIADIDGSQVAYGFLCGREYENTSYVSNNKSGFDLMKAHRQSFRCPSQKRSSGSKCCIGLPAALHMVEDIPFWRYFFNQLGIHTITSEGFEEALKSGKRIAAAEFCAPMTAMYGHVRFLMERADHVFFPYYMDMERKKSGPRRQYCYYTQFAPSLAAFGLKGVKAEENRLLTPLIHYLYSTLRIKMELVKTLHAIGLKTINFTAVSAAFDAAVKFKDRCFAYWRRYYHDAQNASNSRLRVVLLGRPYNILSPTMNKGIPNIFASLGVKTYFQDMLQHDQDAIRSIQPQLNELHWYYSAEIMKSAVTAAEEKHVYPVLITAFKCSPDSFVIDYFKELMAAYDKPYLILQLDEHGSKVGYETRIEAAVRSFQNHQERDEIRIAPVPCFSPQTVSKKNTFEKTLVIPNWDTLSLSLVVANLRREGIDARLMEESETGIQKSLRTNSGQCIPLNIIAQEFIDFMAAHRLDPSRTALWLVTSSIPCNLRLYPSHVKRLLHAYGHGVERADVLSGAISFADISMKLAIPTYFAYMFGGMLKKIGCRIRPYEKFKGSTDRVIQQSLEIFNNAFLGHQSKTDALKEVVSLFQGIETGRNPDNPKPKVAIFGDLYARDNECFNQDLIHFIEAHGGEVVTTPYSSYVKMIAKPYLRKWFVEGNYLNALSSKALITAATHLEKKYHHYFDQILTEPEPQYDDSPEKILSQYHLRIEHTGESMDNIIKIYYIIKHYPDISLFVQTSPAFCCPSLVTEAMVGEIERKTGIPIVSITYDGTGGLKNDIIIPYLKYPALKTVKPATVQNREMR